eukprot:scaffold282667_cov30-Tisochrysis_lutea.AAC.2
MLRQLLSLLLLALSVSAFDNEFSATWRWQPPPANVGSTTSLGFKARLETAFGYVPTRPSQVKMLRSIQ